MPKSESLNEIFARKISYTKADTFYKELHTPHLKPFLSKPWKGQPGETAVGLDWGIRAEGMYSPPGPFAVEELRAFFSVAGIALTSGRPAKEIRLRVQGAAKDRVSAESFRPSARRGRNPRRVTLPIP